MWASLAGGVNARRSRRGSGAQSSRTYSLAVDAKPPAWRAKRAARSRNSAAADAPPLKGSNACASSSTPPRSASPVTRRGRRQPEVARLVSALSRRLSTNVRPRTRPRARAGASRAPHRRRDPRTTAVESSPRPKAYTRWPGCSPRSPPRPTEAPADRRQRPSPRNHEAKRGRHQNPSSAMPATMRPRRQTQTTPAVVNRIQGRQSRPSLESSTKRPPKISVAERREMKAYRFFLLHNENRQLTRTG